MTKLDTVIKAEQLLRVLGEVLTNEVLQLTDDQDSNGGPLSSRGIQRLQTIGPQVLAYSKAAKELLSESVAASLSEEELAEALKLSEELERLKREEADA